MPTIIDGDGGVNGVTVAIATQAEAEEGTASNKLMTPERTAQSITTEKVLLATSNATYGAVGTYIFAGRYLASAGGFTEGQTYAGSALRPSGAAVIGNLLSDGSDSNGYPTGGGSVLSGTWMAMGRAQRSSSGSTFTLFLRVA
jgi:hypothetical protein